MYVYNGDSEIAGGRRGGERRGVEGLFLKDLQPAFVTNSSKSPWA